MEQEVKLKNLYAELRELQERYDTLRTMQGHLKLLHESYIGKFGQDELWRRQMYCQGEMVKNREELKNLAEQIKDIKNDIKRIERKNSQMNL